MVDESTAYEITVAEICIHYAKHARRHYRNHGKPTTELELVTYVLRDFR